MTLGMAMTFQITWNRQCMYEIMDKLDFTEIRNFCSVKNSSRMGAGGYGTGWKR